MRVQIVHHQSYFLCFLLYCTAIFSVLQNLSFRYTRLQKRISPQLCATDGPSPGKITLQPHSLRGVG